MKVISLNGKWTIKNRTTGSEFIGDVPGTDVGNLIKYQNVKNPLISGDEQEGIDIAKNDFSFLRDFKITKDEMAFNHLSIKCDSIDTICDVIINGKVAFSLNNAHVPLDRDIKEFLCVGDNQIEFKFSSPYNYIIERQSKNPLPKNFNGVDGISYIRKQGCHFGWDWGPCVPYTGILGDIGIKAFNKEIKNVRVDQITTQELSKITISADGANSISLFDPNGKEINGKNSYFEVVNPQLWYTREMSETETQPLYKVVLKNDEEVVEKLIGLRDCYLDQKNDEIGRNFCIMLNGEKVFAKGGNLIPFSAIWEDTTKEVIDYYINLAIKSNFNILRVWGGGTYASEYLLSQCDKYGLLVWQDLCYACQMYPFYDEEFLENVKNELVVNVKRMSLHPSVCLWAGNNEIETMYFYLPKGSKLMSSYHTFFYEIAPEIISKLTRTSYIPTSPLGSKFLKDITSDNYGDTHMWNVWHGLKKLDYYATRHSRFLSEFGLESLPSMKAIKTFANKEEDFDINSKAFNTHQKCTGGNQKMMFYLTEMFDFPTSFEFLPYLTGIVQAECIKNATVHFRQNKGLCNGSIYWQYNDVWNCPSWSSVDFERVPKALQYMSRDFFNPVTVTCEKKKGIGKLVAHNDSIFAKTLNVKLKTIKVASGEITSEEKYTINLAPNSLEKVVNKKMKQDEVLEIDVNGVKTYELFNTPSKLKLQPNPITYSINSNRLKIEANNFAYGIFIDTDEIPNENYFSLAKGEIKEIVFNKPIKDVKITSCNDIEFNKNAFKKKWFRFTYRLKPENIANFVFYSMH